MALFGESEEEKKIRERAEAAQRDYEARTGEQVPEEAGIEPDYTAENAAMLIAAPGAGMTRKAGQFALNEAKDVARKGVLGRIKNAKHMPAPSSKDMTGVGAQSGQFSPEPKIESTPGTLNYSYPGRKIKGQ